MENNALLSEIEHIGLTLLPTIIRIAVSELDPTCDVDGAVKSAEGLAANLTGLVTALRARPATPPAEIA